MPDTPLIFLDLDGVLNDHTPFANGYCGTTPSCVAAFNRVLAAVPEAMIVISSAWRYIADFSPVTTRVLENVLLTHGVNCHERVIGHTCRDEEIAVRGQQIRHWLNEHGGDRRYVVIDDGGINPDGTPYDLGIGEAGHPFVWTDSAVGLRDVEADRVIEILTGARVTLTQGAHPCEPVA